MDRVKINVRERPYSGDINDAQAMQARMLASFLRNLGAKRQLAGSGELVDTLPRHAVVGLDAVPTAGGASVTVNPGMLAQFSAVWPSAPAALEDTLRLGYLRSAVTVSRPATVLAFQLLEARVVDVVTQTDSRDILDPASGNFVPATVDKQIERQLEFQVVDGVPSSLQIPAFSGAPWVPLYAWMTDAAGLWLGNSMVFDFRVSFQEAIEDHPVYGDSALTTVEDRCDCSVEAHSLSIHSQALPKDFTANFQGRAAGRRVWFRAQGGARAPLQTPVVCAGYTATPDTMEHLYLVPAIANGIEVYPVCTFPQVVPGTGHCAAHHKGILLATGTQPIPGGPSASAALTHLASGLWRNFSPVPASRALHVASYYMKTGLVPYYFSQSRGGHVQIASNAAGLAANLTQRVTWLAGTATPQTANFDFNGKIPDNARFALVEIQVWPNGGNPSVTLDVLRPGGVSPDDSIYTVGLTTVASVLYLTTGLIPVPLLFNTVAGTTDRIATAQMGFTPSPSANNLTIQCRVRGWIY